MRSGSDRNLCASKLIHIDSLGENLLLSTIEKNRVRVLNQTETTRKTLLGQFLTPIRTAEFMASLFTPTNLETCNVLDPGAGIGSLSCAFLERWLTGDFLFHNIQLETFEVDRDLHAELHRSLSLYKAKSPLNYTIQAEDFIEEAVQRIQIEECSFTHVILNPPYKKLAVLLVTAYNFDQSALKR
jgi:adenine-specific DNA-methyltransferase